MEPTLEQTKAICEKLYEKYSEKIEQISVKIGVDLREELIKIGMPENQVFYSIAFEVISEYLENGFKTSVGIGITTGTISNEVEEE